MSSHLKKPLFPFFIVLALAFTLSAQEKDIKVEPIKLTDKIYVLKGPMSDTAVYLGKDEVLVIDSNDSKEMAEKAKKAISGLSKKPVKYLINTHWHFDHVEGNEVYASHGTILIGQDEMRSRAATQKGMRGQAPLKGIALPAITYKDAMTLHLDGEEMLLIHPKNPAHTDGDTVVFFKKSNVIHMGDLYFEGLYPFIDTDAGGSINGMIEADEEMMKLMDDKTIVIPGHGPVTNKKQLEAFVSMLKGVSAKITALIKEGKSLEEVKALKPTAEYDAKWGNGFFKPDQFTEFAYKGLKKNLK